MYLEATSFDLKFQCFVYRIKYFAIQIRLRTKIYKLMQKFTFEAFTVGYVLKNKVNIKHSFVMSIEYKVDIILLQKKGF